MVLLLQDEFIMFQLRVKKQCCSLLLPVCLVFEIHHVFCLNRINSTELKIIREKGRVCVYFLYVHVTLGYIGNAANALLVNIVFPSGCHRVLIFVRALRGLYDVVLPS